MGNCPETWNSSQENKKVSCQILLLKHFLFSVFNKIDSKAKNRLTVSLRVVHLVNPPIPSLCLMGKVPQPVFGIAQRPQPSETTINCCLWVNAHIKKTNDKQSLPKSTSLTPPSVVRRMLFPLTSRWMIWLLCKCWRPCMASHHHQTTGKRKGNFAWLF